MRVPSQRFVTWLLIALAAVLVTVAGGTLGYYLDTRPVAESPGTHTTAPAETVRVTTPGAVKTRTRTETQTRTVQVPGPTVTVTETVEVPGPTETVTETHTVTVDPFPDPTPSDSPTETPEVSGGGGKAIGSGAVNYAAQPMVLNVDTGTDAGWAVAGAARAWNRALGCRVFELIPSGRGGQTIYTVTQTEPNTLRLGDQYVRALHTGYPVFTVQFDPAYGIASFVAVHELGHALGLHHGDGAGSIMNVSNPNRHLHPVPSAADIRQALANQVDLGRCAA